MNAPAPVRIDRSRVVTLEIPFRFLTPVFGGGVRHVENSPNNRKPLRPFDEVTPVRATGVRGQLRFWWRATTGSRCSTLSDMKRREAELWGGIWSDHATPGAVSVAVSSGRERPTAHPVFSWGQGNFPQTTDPDVGYGAFPLRPEGNPGPGPDERSALWNWGDVVHRLYVTFPAKHHADVVLSISAWLAFGGYGGRLTRGFGAVALAPERCATLGQQQVEDVPSSVLKRIEALGPPMVAGVPAVSDEKARLVVKPRKSSPVAAWQYGLEKLRYFRQMPGGGRNAGSGIRPGRSRWPEPDEIRRLTRKKDPTHAVPVNEGGAFPRAEFGLPIIFHFQSNRDPDDCTLQTSDSSERFPSPLILRPTAANEPMALWLANVRPPTRLVLRATRDNHMVSRDVAAAPLAKLMPHQRELLHPSPIEAFLNRF